MPKIAPDAPMAGTPLSAAFLAQLAHKHENVRYFKIETAGAASKLRELIAIGGDVIEGPWDGEEAITLLADLDALLIEALFEWEGVFSAKFTNEEIAERRRKLMETILENIPTGVLSLDANGE